MDIKELHSKYLKVVEKYKLSDEQKASEIADYIMKNKILSADDFASDFAMDLDDAKVFLNFLKKGLDFKKNLVNK